MPSPGEGTARSAADLLAAARRGERTGCMAEAIDGYEAAIAEAERAGEGALLAAEALNTLGGLDLAAGSLAQAATTFLRALDLGGSSRRLRARVQQNLGIVANIQGELSEALARYERSLAAYRECGDDHGCAIAYHNLGMV